MSSFITLALMSVVLGAGSFATGILPLSFVFSRSAVARLTSFGSGLLLGAALGIIIPEGMETTVYSQLENGNVPTQKIALSLLAGFTFMLIIEQLLSPHSHSHSYTLHTTTQSERRSDKPASLDFDAELGELERGPEAGTSSHSRNNSGQSTTQDNAVTPEMQYRAYPLTMGLVMHALADGLALGSSILSDPGSSELSFIVFLALIIHKAPTALALTTSLLGMSLPRSDCKKHIAIFSVATPIGALISYAVLSMLDTNDNGDWTGIAMLISGGSFLYVATVLQPVSSASGIAMTDEDIGPKMKALFIVLGMFVPVCISSFISHGHGHS